MLRCGLTDRLAVQNYFRLCQAGYFPGSLELRRTCSFYPCCIPAHFRMPPVTLPGQRERQRERQHLRAILLSRSAHLLSNASVSRH